MPLPKDGLIPWKTGDELAWIELHEEDSRTTIYGPTYEEIQELCEKHELDFGKIMLLVRTKRPNITGLLIHGPTMRGEVEEKQ